jgi:hypothetical protein
MKGPFSSLKSNLSRIAVERSGTYAFSEGQSSCTAAFFPSKRRSRMAESALAQIFDSEIPGQESAWL